MSSTEGVKLVRPSALDVHDPSSCILSRLNGDLPIVLSAPHGGPAGPLLGNQATELTERTKGKLLGDKFTLELTLLLDQYIRELTGRSPQVVAALFNRRYVDPNRAAASGEAYPAGAANESSRLCYEEYHNQLNAAIAHAASLSPTGRVLLLDIHGQVPYADMVVVGTRFQVSCDMDIANSPYTGFVHNLRRLLGSSVVPGPGHNDVPAYSGAYILERHATGRGGRVDGLQLECGCNLRNSSHLRAQLASNLAMALYNSLIPNSQLVTFLEDVGLGLEPSWRKSDAEKVFAKFQKINCFTPSDVRYCIGQEGGINGRLKALGDDSVKMMKEDTITAMKAHLDPSHRCSNRQVCVGQRGPSSASGSGQPLYVMRLGETQMQLLTSFFVFDCLRDDNYVSLASVEGGRDRGRSARIRGLRDDLYDGLQEGTLAVLRGYRILEADSSSPLCVFTGSVSDRVQGRLVSARPVLAHSDTGIGIGAGAGIGGTGNDPHFSKAKFDKLREAVVASQHGEAESCRLECVCVSVETYPPTSARGQAASSHAVQFRNAVLWMHHHPDAGVFADRGTVDVLGVALAEPRTSGNGNGGGGGGGISPRLSPRPLPRK